MSDFDRIRSGKLDQELINKLRRVVPDEIARMLVGADKRNTKSKRVKKALDPYEVINDDSSEFTSTNLDVVKHILNVIKEE